MARNVKRSKKMSVLTSRAVHAGAVLLAAFAMIILNMLASSSGSQLMKTIGEKRRTLASLEEERDRESGRWDEMKSPDKLETALLRHGLAMRYPKPEQIIWMDANGVVIPHQLSVAKAAQRSATVKVAQSRHVAAPARRKTVRR